MNVLSDLLQSKFQGQPFDVKKWADVVQPALVRSVLGKRGLHQDEKDNYNSYLPEIAHLVKVHVNPQYLDQFDQLHTLEMLDPHYTLPYEAPAGIDNPERALIRNHYEGQIRGIVRYTIRTRAKANASENQVGWVEDSGEHGDAPKKRKAEDVPEEEVKVETDVDEAEAEADTDDIELEDPAEHTEDEADKDADEDSGEESEREDTDEEAEEEDEEESEIEGEEEDETGEDEEKKTPSISPSKAKKSVKFADEFRPSVGKSRHTDVPAATPAPTTTAHLAPAFFVQKENYSAYSNVVYKETTEHIVLDIPVWIGSRLCWMSTSLVDPFLLAKPYLLGCAYIVARNFKICPYEEYYANNRVLGLKADKVEIRSKFYQDTKRFRTNCTLKFIREDPKCRKNSSWFRLPRFLLEIPHEKPKAFCSVTVLAMAYGWTQGQFIDAIRMFLKQERSEEIDMFLTVIALDTEECRNQHDAVSRMGHYLSKCKTMANPTDVTSYVSFTLRGEFLPNLVDLVTDDHNVENLLKGYALAEALAELIQLSEIVNEKRPAHEKWKETDRRSYCIKRVDTPGEKLTFLARKYIKHFAKKGASNLKKAVDNRKGIDIKAILNRKMIKLTNSVKNGIWDSKTDASDSNQNKTQMMITGYTSDALHSQVQKFVKASMKKNCNPEPLLTHPTQHGRVDLYLTPESEKCGIVRNKALGCWITPLVNAVKLTQVIRRIIEQHAVKLGWIPLGKTPIFPDQSYTIVKDLCGGVMGWVRHPLLLYQMFVKLRRRGALWFLLGFEWDRRRNLFYFAADEGRLARPIIVLDRLRDLFEIVACPAFLYHHDPIRYLLEQGIVEYLDASEEYCGMSFVADSLETAIRCDFMHTHLEIHGLFAFSVTVSKAFCNFNQGPRRLYTGNMEKRSLSLKMFDDRGTTVSYSLMNAQDPLLSEPVDDSLQLRHKEPNGTNVCCAFYSDGNTNEDCYVQKKESIDRGLCVSSETMVMTVQVGTNCVFAKPGNRTKGRASPEKYDGLNNDGTPKVGYNFTGGMCVVGREFGRKEGSEIKKRCVSKFLPWHQDYAVIKVERYPIEETKPIKVLRVSLSKINTPTVGDKYFFTHGQKGTVSSIRPAIDMPFFAYGPMAGQSPDILLNVCALSRVTLGLHLEMLWGKARCLNPTAIAQYQTVFLSLDTFEDKMRLCAAVLKEAGLNYTGKEKMRLGTTGEEIQCDIFSGFAYLGVLKQMSRDKLRSRERGPVNELTRQTSVGKKQQGGQKQVWQRKCLVIIHFLTF